MKDYTLSPKVGVGHVHLRVADLDRSTAFYRDVLGFHVTADGRQAGIQAVFLAADDYHHHIGLNTWESAGAPPPPPGHTGVYHVAFVYPDRAALGRAVEHVLALDYPIDSAMDHGATISVYLRDPDDIGIELYYDCPRELWFDSLGRPVLKAEHFEASSLIAEAEVKREV